MKMKTNEEFLKELNQNLSKEIPHKWRVQSFSKNKPSATVVAYIDARDASDALNEYAIYGWHDDYYEVGGNTYCKVGIVMPDGTVQWRSDCGTESNQDKEKGQASDAFKRACVKWGIGRFLYNLEIEYVNSNEAKTQSNFPYPVDEQGKRIWNLTEYINNRKKSGAKTAPSVAPSVPSPALQPNASFDTKPAKKELPKDPKVSEVIDYAVSNASHTAIYATDDDRKAKALASLKAIDSLNDQMKFIAKIAEFKKSNKVKGFKLGTSIEDLVEKNTLEAIIEFYKFVK